MADEVKPIISVIIPVYNTERSYLDRCLSVFKTHVCNDIEVIVVDDGSEVVVADYLDQMREEFKISVTVIHKENGGQSSARNTGIAAATGSYIEFLDSDDYIDWHEQLRVLKVLKEKSPDILAINAVSTSYQGRVLGRQTLGGEKGYRPLDKRTMIMSAGAMWMQIFRRDLFIRFNYRLVEGPRVGEDMASVVPIFIKAKTIYGLNSNLYYYVQRDTSVVHSSNSERRMDIIPALQEMMKRISREDQKVYYEELEWLAIKHILVFAVSAVLLCDGTSSPKISMLKRSCSNLFPKWQQNKYLEEYKHSKNIQIRLMLTQHYRIFILVDRLRPIVLAIRTLVNSIRKKNI